jgi:hypothetical protein
LAVGALTDWLFDLGLVVVSFFIIRLLIPLSF